MTTVRLLDASLSDIKGKLQSYAKIIEKQKKKDPNKVPLWVIVRRGDVEMKKGEWLKNPSLADKLTLTNFSNIFDEKNLNMGVLGYGSTKGGLQELLKWVKHNVNPKKLQGDKRDLNIKIEHLRPGKKGRKFGVMLELRVPEKGAESSKDLGNVKLEEMGYIGLKKWLEDQLGELEKSDDKLDKVLYAVLKGDVDLKDKIEEVLK